MPASLTDGLAELLLASGIDKNAFCEEVLSAAVEKRIEKVRVERMGELDAYMLARLHPAAASSYRFNAV